VLETAAASNNAVADQKGRSKPAGVALPATSGAAAPAPLRAPAPAAHLTAGAAAKPGNTAPASTAYNPSGNQKASAPVHETGPAGPAQPAEERQPSAREREYHHERGRPAADATRGGRDSSAPVAMSTAGTEHKDGYSSGDASERDDADEGVGSSDSEDDWRAMRDRQKKTAERAQARSAASGGSVTSAPRPGGGAFWGAYGAPTSRTLPSRADAAPQTAGNVGSQQPEQEEIEDARYNPSVRELVAASEASFRTQLTELSESSDDEEDDDTELAVSHAATEGYDEGGLAEDTSFDEAESSFVTARSPPASPARGVPGSVMKSTFYTPGREAGAVRFDLSDISPIPSSPPGAPASSAAASLPPPPPPEKSSPPAVPVPEVVPLSAGLPVVPVAAVSGSLASAAAPAQSGSGLLSGGVSGARRGKGKAASIMNSARPRKAGTEGAPDASPPKDQSVPADAETLPPPPPAAHSTVSPPAVPTAESVLTAVPPSAPFGEDTVPTHTVAERHAAALKRAITLDDLAAPVLSPLPYAYVSNKAAGSVVEFPSATLPAKLSGVGCGVERIVVVDILTERLQLAVAGTDLNDTALAAVVEWLLSALNENYTLLALQSHSMSGQTPVCRAVLETRTEDVTGAELTAAAQATPLYVALHVPESAARSIVNDSGSPTPVSEVLSVRDSYSAPLLAELSCFASPIANELGLLRSSDSPGDDAVANVVHAKDVAVCAVKSHVLQKQHLQGPNTIAEGAEQRGVLSELVAQCERNGLRLCGLRLVYLSALELFEYESFCSIPGYSKPCAPDGASALRHDPHLLPVLCVAFHSANAAALEIEEAALPAAPARVGASSVTNVAATVLRGVLGPDDPELARRTDPASLRALYGTTKEHNLAYPIPHSVDRLLKETTFWFGGRRPTEETSTRPTGATAVPPVSLLTAATPQYLQLRWSLSTERTGLHAGSAGQLSAVQSIVLSAVADTFGVTGLLHSLVTERQPSVVGADGSSDTVQTFSACYLTHVCVSYVYNCVRGIIARADSLRTPWRVIFAWEFTAVSRLAEAPVATGSRLLALEMLKRASEDDCKSHEDVGLQDVIVLTLGNYPVLQPADEFSAHPDVLGRRQHPSHSAAVLLPVLSKLLHFLPRPCDTHVVAVKTNATASGLVAVVRGYQVIENIDHAIAEMQRVTGGGMTITAGQSTRWGKATEGSDKRDANGLKAAELEGRIAQSARAYKWRKALEILFTEFPLSSVYVDLALRELYTYVPLPGLQRSGLEWQHQAAAVGEAAGTVAAQPYTSTQYLQALFPPGVFTATAVLLVPWAQDDAAMIRNLAKIVTRLEKERFSIVEVKVVSSVSPNLVCSLYHENCAEYVISGGRMSGDVKNAAVDAMLTSVAACSFVAILVRRRSALLQLKSVVGPVFSAEVAEAQYPRSIVCLLDSLHSHSGSTAHALTQPVPYILPTLSCASAQAALQELFPHFYASYDAQQAALSLNHVPHELHASAADSANIVHLTEVTEGSGFVEGMQLRVPTVARLDTVTAEPPTAAMELQLKPEGTEGTTQSAVAIPGSSVLTRSVDIAGVVLTHALMQEMGLGTILEALHREGLLVRDNHLTCHVLPLPDVRVTLFSSYVTLTPRTCRSPPPSTCSSWPAPPACP
jgi:nucleoside diphosphate kinase